MSATGVLTRALDKGPERRRDPDRDFLGLAAGERGGGGGGGEGGEGARAAAAL